MPNLCDYEMKIKGSKEAIERVIDCLKADYNYGAGKPSHKHFFRVFEVNVDFMEENKDGTFTALVWGDCAWSVQSCMLKSGYYNDCKKDHPDIFMGTDLVEQSKDCEIEVFSEETGMLFSEHYIYKYGVCECDNCIDIEIDTDDDDYIVHNTNRASINEGFDWTI